MCSFASLRTLIVAFKRWKVTDSHLRIDSFPRKVVNAFVFTEQFISFRRKSTCCLINVKPWIYCMGKNSIGQNGRSEWFQLLRYLRGIYVTHMWHMLRECPSIVKKILHKFVLGLFHFQGRILWLITKNSCCRYFNLTRNIANGGYGKPCFCPGKVHRPKN